MSRNEITTGIGLRHVRVALRDTDGTIDVPAGTVAATAYGGSWVSGALSLTIAIPEPQKISARGDDRAYYTFILPPTETPSGELRVSKTNGPVIALLTGTKQFGSPNIRKVGFATDKVGEEPSTQLWGSRRGIDSEDGSAYFGQTIWQTYFFLNAAVQIKPATMEDQAVGEFAFSVTANDACVDEIGKTMTEGEHGFTKASYIQIITTGRFILEAWMGAPTTAFNLGHTPTATSVFEVTVGGAIKTYTTDYTVAGKVLTFVSPQTGKVICQYEATSFTD